MASSTCDRLTLPDEQAEPDDSAIPCKIEGDQRCFGLQARYGKSQGVRQPLRALAKNTTASGADPAQLAAPPCPEAPGAAPLHPSSLRCHDRRRRAEPAIAADILGAGPVSPLLPAAPDEPVGDLKPVAMRGSLRQPLLGRRSCGRRASPHRRPRLGISIGHLCRPPARHPHGEARFAHERARAASAIGWMTPVSLFAAWSETRPPARACRARRCSSQARSITPVAVDRQRSRPASSGNRCPSRTDGCSMAPTSRSVGISWRHPPQRRRQDRYCWPPSPRS